jgi:hypothetical protein
LKVLTVTKPHWHSALYWVHVQPWDRWETERRKDWENAGREWLATECDGRLPMVEPPPVTLETPRQAKRRWIAEMLENGFTVRRICSDVGCSDRLVKEIADGMKAKA